MRCAHICFTPQTPAGLPTFEACERAIRQQRFRVKLGMTGKGKCAIGKKKSSMAHYPITVILNLFQNLC